MSTTKSRGRWRVQWYNRAGLIRKEWFRKYRQATMRKLDLERGHYGVTIYDDSDNHPA